MFFIIARRCDVFYSALDLTRRDKWPPSGDNGYFSLFLMRSRNGRAVISFICNNMDDCVPISRANDSLKTVISSLLLANKHRKGTLDRVPHGSWVLQPFFPRPMEGFVSLIPQTRDGAKLTVVMSIQTRSILIFFLCCSRYSKDQKRPFHAHVWILYKPYANSQNRRANLSR